MDWKEEIQQFLSDNIHHIEKPPFRKNLLELVNEFIKETGYTI